MIERPLSLSGTDIIKNLEIEMDLQIQTSENEIIDLNVKERRRNALLFND